MCTCSIYVIHNMWRSDSLDLIKYSRLYSTFSKAVKKIYLTKNNFLFTKLDQVDLENNILFLSGWKSVF